MPHLLLVEDDPKQARLTQAWLTQPGTHEATVTWRGRLDEALAVLREQPVDLILLDLTLPDSRGLETFLAVQAQAPQIPVVIVTCLDDEALALDAVRRGAQEFVVKGTCDARMLWRVIGYALERHRLHEERRKREDDIHAVNRRLTELVAWKDELVSTLSHELRTPLTAIKEGVSLLLMASLGPLTEEQREFLATIDGDIERMIELSTQFLDMAKIQAGRFRLQRTQVQLAELISSTVKSYRALLGARTVTVELPFVPAVYGDAARLLQVLGNLVSNAVKFTSADGTITLSLHERGDQVAVSVRDSGVGIAPDDLPKLFGQFSQVGEGTRQRRGTGLGLALCKELVELHGGTIEAASELGKGSTFTVTLPVYRPARLIEQALRRAIELATPKHHEQLGVLVLDVDTVVQPEEAGSVRLTDVEELVRSDLQRDDVVVAVEPTWIVVIAATNEPGLVAIEKRVQELLSGSRLGTAESRTMPVATGTAWYPQAGREASAVFERALRSLRAKRTEASRAARANTATSEPVTAS